jgi:hypothetical protein
MSAEPLSSPGNACQTDSGILWRTAAGAHMAGVLVPGLLMFNTEGPAAGLGSGLVNVVVAWWNIVAVVMFCGVQAIVLTAWRRCALSFRRAAELEEGLEGGIPACPQGWPGSFVIKGCAGLLFLAAWTAEAGYLAEAVTAVQAGGWHEPVSRPAVDLIAAAILAGALALITGVTALLAHPAHGQRRRGLGRLRSVSEGHGGAGDKRGCEPCLRARTAKAARAKMATVSKNRPSPTPTRASGTLSTSRRDPKRQIGSRTGRGLPRGTVPGQVMP